MTIILLWVGLPMILAGLFCIIFENRRRAECVPVKGRITGFASGRSTKRNRPMYYAVVEFTDLAGRNRFVQSSVGSSTPLGKVGDEEIVLTKNNDHDYAVLKSKTMYVIGFFAITLGTIFLSIFAKKFNNDWFALIISLVIPCGIFFRIWKTFRSKAVRPDGKTLAEVMRKAVTSFEKRDEINWHGQQEETHTLQTVAPPAPLPSHMPFYAVVTFICLAIATYTYEKTHRFLAIAQPAPGVVTALEQTRSSKGSTTSRPIIEFTVPNTKTIIHFKFLFSSRPSFYDVGDKVDVLYDPRDPNDARVNFGIWNYWAAIISGGIGFLTSLGLLKAIRAKASEPNFAISSPVKSRKIV